MRFHKTSFIRTQIEQKAREIVAKLSPIQKFQLALEILQNQEADEAFAIPEELISQSTERLERYFQNPESGSEAYRVLEEIREKYLNS